MYNITKYDPRLQYADVLKTIQPRLLSLMKNLKVAFHRFQKMYLHFWLVFKVRKMKTVWELAIGIHVKR